MKIIYVFIHDMVASDFIYTFECIININVNHSNIETMSKLFKQIVERMIRYRYNVYWLYNSLNNPFQGLTYEDFLLKTLSFFYMSTDLDPHEIFEFFWALS